MVVIVESVIEVTVTGAVAVAVPVVEMLDVVVVGGPDVVVVGPVVVSVVVLDGVEVVAFPPQAASAIGTITIRVTISQMYLLIARLLIYHYSTYSYFSNKPGWGDRAATGWPPLPETCIGLARPTAAPPPRRPVRH